MSTRNIATALLLACLICMNAWSAEPIEIKAYEGDCWMLAYAADGKHVFTLPNKGSVMKAWDAATSKLVWEAEETGHLAIRVSPNGEQVAVGAWGKVRLYDAETGEHAGDIVPSVATGINGIDYSPDGSLLAVTLKEQNVVDVFEVESGERLLTLTVPMKKPAKGTGGISRVAFSPDGKTLVAACGGRGWPDFVGEDSVIGVWDVKTWKLRTSFTASTHNVNSLAISPDGKLIAASCHRAQEVKIWRMPAAVDKPEPEVIAKLVKQLDSDDFGEREAAERKLRLMGEPARAQLTKALDGDSAEAAFRARKILAGMKAAEDNLWHTIQAKSDFQTVAFSPDGRYLATGSISKNENALRLWRLGDALAVTKVANKRGVWSVQFSPDGKQLAQATPDGAVLLHAVEDLLPD